MAKVLKVVASIASVVAVIPGPWQLPAAAIAVGASIGSTLLTKRPKAPKVTSSLVDRLNVSIDPRTPRKACLGVTAGRVSIR